MTTPLASIGAMGSDHGDATFDEALQIDMRGLVGDAVGNMSISPTNRNVVLAARKGLFIIDLNAPLEVPRFLPQGGTWDVADVQWNPHLSHANYVVSTSSEKLLIWNLLLNDKMSIEHILHSHYRAITDINWHPSDPNLVVSTGIDGWLWAWDLRVTQKPFLGLYAFNVGGTQVKWNRQDENILASSHMNQIMIWDRRKGSLPVSNIEAHAAKIYGVDWSPDRRNEIVTCSLDRTIKVFDVQMMPDGSSVMGHPKITFQTSYPVWRARNLPFGRGILSLPQRGENTLEMYTHDDTQTPVQTFEGHTDVVKEFVWRRGGQDCNEFQLITWSKDKTLRFWPMDEGVVHKLGSTRISPISSNLLTQSNFLESSRTSTYSGHTISCPPHLSAPIGHILAEVRAVAPTHPRMQPVPLRQARGDPPTNAKSVRQTQTPSAPTAIANMRGSTMTRGNGVKKPTRMDTLSWWSSVKVGEKKDGSSEADSVGEGGSNSQVSSTSRRDAKHNTDEKVDPLKRIDSKVKVDDEAKENDVGQSLQDEITHVITKLTAYKIRLEKHDLTKKRTCTLGLHGPWGEKSSVFIRITFTFPKDYPQAAYPGGIPTVELERNPLISLKDRAFMLRRLRVLRETCRPCLEPCLKFLLFGNDGDKGGSRRNPGSSSSDEDDDSRIDRPTTSPKNEAVPYLMLRNDKNLAEPRTSQGVFGPNGELVCFSRAPPRIVRNPLHDISVSPSIGSHQGPDTMPRLFRSPALLSDAINQLSLASNDRASSAIHSSRKPEDATNILRIMTNLLTGSKRRRLSERSKPVDATVYSLLPTRRSTVFIKDTNALINPDRHAASDYILNVTDAKVTCQKNAILARKMGRFDHERAFQVLKIFIESKELKYPPTMNKCSKSGLHDPVGRVCTKLYNELCVNKDVQMLAMVSVVLLHFGPSAVQSQSSIQTPIAPQPIPDPNYFIRAGRIARSRIPSARTGWYHAQSPLSPRDVTAAPSSSSSRGSWSSLFSTGSMRHLMTSVPEPQEHTTHTNIPGQIPVPGSELSHRQIRNALLDSSLKRMTKSPFDPSPSSAGTKPPARQGVRRPTFSQIVSTNLEKANSSKRLVVVTSMSSYDSPVMQAGIDPQFQAQLIAHINSYAEVLFRWQLLRQRAELIKCVNSQSTSSSEDYRLGIDRICTSCGKVVGSLNSEVCFMCKGQVTWPRCSFCRLPVKGLSRICGECGHVTHMKCTSSLGKGCVTGCGCICVEINSATAYDEFG